MTSNTTDTTPETAETPETREPKLITFALPKIGWVETVLLLSIPGAVAVALSGMIFSGAFSNYTLIDPGLLVTRGLPVARVIHDAAAAVTVGLLLLATFVLPGQNSVPGVASYTQWTAARWAARAAAVWAAAGIAVLLFTAATTIGVPLTDDRFGKQFLFFATSIELGQSLLVSVAGVLLAFVTLLLSKRVSVIAFATAVGVLALLPLALSGHAAGSDEHANAVDSLAIHLVGVTAWVGGLTGLILLRKRLGTSLPAAVGRYSTMAVWAFAAVAFSGIINASLRISSPADLLQPYGLLIVIKAAILILLGLAGVWQRQLVIPKLIRDPGNHRHFVRLAVTEVLFMAVAIGVSVALSKSAPPVSQGSVAGVDIQLSLLGFPFPPSATLLTMLTQVHVDWAFAGAAAVLAGVYIAGVLRLRRRGDSWPVGRTVSWVLGCVLLVYVTSGGPGVYGQVSFSTHMIQHMGLMMFVPPLLVLGAPILLALRTLPKRHDHSRGLREWILIVVHSRYMKVISHPIVAAILFAGSLVVFYYSDWFEFSLDTHQGHVLMCLHFLATGYLFFWVIIGVDPGPARPSYPLRLILLLATLAFHAFFGLAIMSSDTIFAIDWWHSLGYTDDAALLNDQHVGGGIAWGAGELPVLFVTLAVVRQWVTSEEREAKRYDRNAERTGDAELAEYNNRLADIARRDGSR